MNSIIKNTIIITLITVVAGVGLGLVYEVTKEPIAKAQESAKQEAYKQVFEAADSFEMVEVDKAEAETALSDAGLTANTVDEVAEAKDTAGETIGYVITTTSKEAYGGDIRLTTGITSDGMVNGISILAISETAGLGMKATEDDFKNQFKEKQVEKFEYTKGGAKADGEVDAISGATITTNAVTNDVNAALAYFQSVLGGGSANE